MKRTNPLLHESWPCPGCGKALPLAGEFMIIGKVMPVSIFQCDHCTRPWKFDGEVFETALTFAVDPDGNLLDPVTGEPFDPEAN